jgi:hypothetical protein
MRVAGGIAGGVVACAAVYLLYAYLAMPGVVSLGRGMYSGIGAVRIVDEPIRGVSPILLGQDTIGRLVSLARIEYRTDAPDTSLIYVGALSVSGPPPYPSGMRAAVDSADVPRFSHELRLIPRDAVGARHPVGMLRLGPDTVLIPVIRSRAVK